MGTCAALEDATTFIKKVHPSLTRTPLGRPSLYSTSTSCSANSRTQALKSTSNSAAGSSRPAACWFLSTSSWKISKELTLSSIVATSTLPWSTSTFKGCSTKTRAKRTLPTSNSRSSRWSRSLVYSACVTGFASQSLFPGASYAWIA